MPAFRLYSKMDTFFGATGQLLSGGSLTFYEAGTSTPANVYGNKALSVNNGSTVALDSSGRPNLDIWGSIAYFVEAFDSLGVKQGEADWVQVPGGEAVALPAPTLGKFLVGNGVSFQLTDVLQLPDPTGHTDKILGTDGVSWFPILKPADGAAGAAGTGVTTTATSIKSGNFLIQTGSGSAAASGSETASVAIVFPVAFTSVPVHVGLQVKDIAVASGVALVAHSVTSVTLAGCTANFNIADRHFVAGSTITNAIPFTYAAFGVKAA